MSRHTSYRGATIDMDSMRRENEKATALGNMGVNAKGDQITRKGVVTKSADQLARENHRVRSAVVNTGLKGTVPASPAVVEQKKPVPVPVSSPVKSTTKKVKEKELPSGDIVVEDDNEE